MIYIGIAKNKGQRIQPFRGTRWPLVLVGLCCGDAGLAVTGWPAEGSIPSSSTAYQSSPPAAPTANGEMSSGMRQGQGLDTRCHFGSIGPKKARPKMTCICCHHESCKRFGTYGRRKIQRWRCRECRVRVPHPSFFEVWDSTTAESLGILLPLKNADCECSTRCQAPFEPD